MLKIKPAIAALLLVCPFLLKAQQPVLRVQGRDSGSVKLSSLNIDVSVTGNMATTTMTMEFCNSVGRVLEGELTFPMPEGVSISRYALDINGKLREAVPVEKEKGQVVFETIVRRNVDPGLLEKVEGNNFRTRIYPIPAKGCRKVLIAYEQELKMSGQNALLYSLPLHFKYPLASFNTRFSIYSSATPEVGEDCGAGLQFSRLKNVFTSSTEKNNFKPNGAFALQIPKMADAAEVQVQQTNGQYYFLVNAWPQAQARQKPMPANLLLLWDASLSGRHRDHEKEFALLDAYFKKAGNMTVQLAQVDFLYQKMNVYTVTGGDWSALRKALENTVYDGAANYGSIQQWPAAQECLFFTGGMNTWGDAATMARCPFPVYTINAAAQANFSLLRMIASQTGGGFINLNEQPVETALAQLTQQQLQLIGVDMNGQVSEVYPSIATPITGNCTVAGISSTPAARITLQLGYGKTVIESKVIDIDAEKQSVANISLAKIWAQKKIAQLDMQYDVFKPLITELGKKYGVVTRNTSLIVLDDVADYVRFDIEPPAELRAEYNRLMAQKEKREQQAEKKTIDQALKFFNDVKAWWKKDYSLARLPVPGEGTAQVSGNAGGTVITGRVTDENGEPLAGATIKMGRTGTSAAADGSFRLQRVNGVHQLQISMVGFQTLRVNVSGGNVVSAALKQRVSTEENVVVSSNQAMTDSAGRFGLASETIRRSPDRNTAAALRRAPGVRVNSVTVTGNLSASQGAIAYAYDSPPVRNPGANTFSHDMNPNAGYFSAAEAQRLPRTHMERVPDRSIDPDGSKGIFKDTLLADDEEIAKAKLVEFIPERNYLKQLDSAATGDLYKKYIDIREQYEQSPSFYFDVAKYFFKKGDTAGGLKILSNLAALNLEDHEVYKMLGYQLKALGRYTEALQVFKKVLEWRPQEPQSFRDYGLALADAGRYQNALDTLYASLLKNFNGEIAGLYPGIEEMTVTEINNIIALHGSGLNTSKIDSRIIKNMPLDIRVVLNWNMNDTDIDLWTFDPNGEKCYYSHKLTRIGGRNSNDFTRGYGPEQFMLKEALNGKYEVKLHYYGSSTQKLAGAATVMAEIYTNYGTPMQQRQVIALQMEEGNEQEGILVGEFAFGEK